VTEPSSTRWNLIQETTNGDQYFIDYQSIYRGAIVEARLLKNLAVLADTGERSFIFLYDCKCVTQVIRCWQLNGFTELMGRGRETVWLGQMLGNRRKSPLFECNGGNDLHPIHETILKMLCSSESSDLGC
jgi:hypothetical protein